MNRLDYLLKEKARIEEEIASIGTGEVANDIAKLHKRQYKKGSYYSRELAEDWALSIRRRNLDKNFAKWEPIIASKDRAKVIERLKEVIESLSSILEEATEDG